MTPPSVLRTVVALVAILFLVPVAAQTYDTCTPEGRAALHSAARNAWSTSIAPPTAGPGEKVTLSGSGFDGLPANNLAMWLLGISGDGQNLDCLVPVARDSTEALSFLLPANGRSDQVCRHHPRRWYYAGSGDVSEEIPSGQAITNNNMELRLDNLLPPSRFALQDLSLFYMPTFGDWRCAYQLDGVGGPIGMQRPGVPFPAPRPESGSWRARSDTVGFLGWRYLTGSEGYPIDGFRVYQHWCLKGYPDPAENCTYESRPADKLRLDGAIRPEDPPFWMELTCDWTGIHPSHQAGPCPDAWRIKPLPADSRQESLVANLGAVPPSFARSRLFLAMTAWSGARGESPPQVFHIDFPDNYGCSGGAQTQRNSGEIQGAIDHFTEQRDPLGFPYLTPFWGETEALPVPYRGRATALVNLSGYPIVAFYPVEDPRIAPFAHFTPVNNNNVPAGPRVLRPSRGYAFSSDVGFANIVVDGRFTDPSGQHRYYVAAHIQTNLNNPVANQAKPVALIAGQALPNSDYAVGMVPPPDSVLELQLRELRLPNGQNPGRIAGTMRGTLVDVLTALPPLPGEIPEDQRYRQIYSFKNEISVTFDLPLYNDECQ